MTQILAFIMVTSRQVGLWHMHGNHGNTLVQVIPVTLVALVMLGLLDMVVVEATEVP